MRHFRADFYELVKEIVKLGSVLIKEFAVGFKSGATDVSVTAFLIGSEHGEREVFAVKIDKGGAVELLISGNELVFLLHERNDFRVKAARGYLIICKEQLSVMRFKLGTEPGSEHGVRKRLNFFAYKRRVLIYIFVFLIIEFVLRVDGIAD